MTEHFALETLRLRLRPLVISDAPAIQMAASAFEIADTMISLPHPYPDGEAERYIFRQLTEQASGKSIAFIIDHKPTGNFAGVIEIRDIEPEHSQSELSFWLASGMWGNGYMREAVEAAVRYGFDSLKLNRLYAYHMLRNQASGRVLEKNGFTREGLLRQRVWKWDKYEDVEIWAILRQDFQSD